MARDEAMGLDASDPNSLTRRMGFKAAETVTGGVARRLLGTSSGRRALAGAALAAGRLAAPVAAGAAAIKALDVAESASQAQRRQAIERDKKKAVAEYMESRNAFLKLAPRNKRGVRVLDPKLEAQLASDLKKRISFIERYYRGEAGGGRETSEGGR